MIKSCSVVLVILFCDKVMFCCFGTTVLWFVMFCCFGTPVLWLCHVLLFWYSYSVIKSCSVVLVLLFCDYVMFCCFGTPLLWLCHVLLFWYSCSVIMSCSVVLVLLFSHNVMFCRFSSAVFRFSLKRYYNYDYDSSQNLSLLL